MLRIIKKCKEIKVIKRDYRHQDKLNTSRLFFVPLCASTTKELGRLRIVFCKKEQLEQIF